MRSTGSEYVQGTVEVAIGDSPHSPLHVSQIYLSRRAHEDEDSVKDHEGVDRRTTHVDGCPDRYDERAVRGYPGRPDEHVGRSCGSGSGSSAVADAAFSFSHHRCGESNSGYDCDGADGAAFPYPQRPSPCARRTGSPVDTPSLYSGLSACTRCSDVDCGSGCTDAALRRRTGFPWA
mmetsp:Transcript_22463/g.68479  ORF Transcript_22463/g.68479 Transcript_22463/m.68479 type:complete len:177 (+) Transcript_22463:776-1306(+)